jgi:hypothetical protein
LTVGGVAGAGAAIYDLSTGRATVGDVLKDIVIFIEGRIAELIAPTYDAELEKTHAYALFLLLIPGVLLVWYNLIPFFKRGNEFQVHPAGSVSVRRGDGCEPLMEYQYSTATADGTTIDFTPPADGPHAVVLPQQRVFSREYGAPARQGQRRVLSAASCRARVRCRVGVVEQQQLHRTPQIAVGRSGTL